METARIFYELARDYCCFIKEEIDVESIQRLIELLMKLYLCAIKLPNVEYDSKTTCPKPKQESIKFNTQIETTYWEIFDPFIQDEPVCGNLIDDLSDIYHDLQIGMMQYDQGRTQNAVWEWKFTFDSHWGNHAIDALRALNTLRTR